MNVNRLAEVNVGRGRMSVGNKCECNTDGEVNVKRRENESECELAGEMKVRRRSK